MGKRNLSTTLVTLSATFFNKSKLLKQYYIYINIWLLKQFITTNIHII